MKVIVDKNFEKSFKKQSLKIKEEFERRMKLFIEDIYSPTLNTHKLSGKLKDLRSFNISGDVRVVFDKSQKDIIILIDIGSHSELYS